MSHSEQATSHWEILFSTLCDLVVHLKILCTQCDPTHSPNYTGRNTQACEDGSE